uniref:Uncharacterized protein n=1 Tax=Mycena chlorophos TaxID=658473 RepID=A0ABQ0KV95_MYCCL|nr:predicted protein [Mycena chlorophos]
MAADDSGEETSECFALDSDSGEECACEEFNDDSEGNCGACGHSRGVHFIPTTKKKPAKGEVDCILDSMLAKGAPSKSAAATKGKGKAKATTSSTSSRRLVAAADKESNKGLKRCPKDEFRVSTFAILPHGTEFDGETGTLVVDPEKNSPLTNADLQSLITQGLAVSDPVNGFCFNRGDYGTLVAQLKEHLPKPLGYLEMIQQPSRAPFYFLTPTTSGFEIIQTARPTGARVSLSTGHASQGWKAHRLVLVSPKPIPRRIIKTWMSSDLSEFQQPSDNEDDKAKDEAELPEIIRPQPKRRLRRVSDDTEEKKRGQKCTKITSTVWSRAGDGDVGNEVKDGDDSEVKDSSSSLADSHPAQPEFLRATSLRPAAKIISPPRASTSRFTSMLENPYDSNKIYNFD